MIFEVSYFIICVVCYNQNVSYMLLNHPLCFRLKK